MAIDVTEVTEKAPATKPKVSARPAPKAEKQPGLPTAIRKGIAAHADAERITAVELTRVQRVVGRLEQAGQEYQRQQAAMNDAATTLTKAQGAYEDVMGELQAAYGPGQVDTETGALIRPSAAEGGNQ